MHTDTFRSHYSPPILTSCTLAGDAPFHVEQSMECDALNDCCMFCRSVLACAGVIEDGHGDVYKHLLAVFVQPLDEQHPCPVSPKLLSEVNSAQVQDGFAVRRFARGFGCLQLSEHLARQCCPFCPCCPASWSLAQASETRDAAARATHSHSSTSERPRRVQLWPFALLKESTVTHVLGPGAQRREPRPAETLCLHLHQTAQALAGSPGCGFCCAWHGAFSPLELL